MTLPNRANYTPGERRRKFSAATEGLQSMQGKAPDHDHADGTPTGNTRTRGGGDDILHEELLQVLSGMAPGDTDAATAAWNHAQVAEFHKQRMIECKARVEAGHQRLYADPCYEQHHSKDESSSFSALLESAAPAESDPLEQLLTGMANDTGLQRGRPSPRLDPQWAALFQQAGAERQQLITNLNKLESGGRNLNPDYDNAMAILHDAPVRSKYQRAVNNVHEWGKHRLYQQLRAAMFSRGGAGRSSPGSPIESPLRQPPKKRANLSKHAKNVLREWFEEHLHHPYPTEDEKDWLSVQGGITIEQVNNWFINTRGRKWKPMLARIINDKTLGGESKLYDHLVKKIEEPYRS